MQKIIKQEHRGLYLSSAALLAPPTTEQPQSKKLPPKATPRRALVVDDNRDARESLATLLSHYGFAVRTACDAESGLTAAKECMPQIMFIDIVLPRVSGYRLAELLRKEPDFRDTTLVAVSGWADETARWLSKNAGLNYHLEKPLNIDALETILSTTHN